MAKAQEEATVGWLADNEDGAVELTRELGTKPETVVAIPAYNEVATIGTVVLAAREHTEHVIVVDDGSTDRTAAVAESAGALVIEQSTNAGKGSAVRTIFAIARHLDTSQLVVLDADWQHDPLEVPKLLEPLESGEADIVIGSRYLAGDRGDTPAYRRLGQKVLDLITVAGTGNAIADSQSGYRAFNRRAIDALELTTDGFGVEVEMLQAASDNSLTVTEVPISINYDVPDANTANSVLHGVHVVDTLLRIVRDRHPLLFFGAPGLVLTVFGLGYGAWTLSIYQSDSTFYVGKALFSAVLLIVGILSIYSALLMNMLGRELEKLT